MGRGLASDLEDVARMSAALASATLSDPRMAAAHGFDSRITRLDKAGIL